MKRAIMVRKHLRKGSVVRAHFAVKQVRVRAKSEREAEMLANQVLSKGWGPRYKGLFLVKRRKVPGRDVFDYTGFVER